MGLLPFHRDGRWGGARPGAGRPKLPAHRRSGVPHRRRGKLAGSQPIHVTVRLRQGARSLRTQLAYSVLLRCFAAAQKTGFRLVHFSVQASHLHLICEAKDRQAMSRGMQGLLIRVSKALNKLWESKGSLWRERYHEHVLSSPREVRNGLCYVLNNLWRHLRGVDAQRHGVIDPFASGAFFDGWRGAVLRTAQATDPPSIGPPVRAPSTWLLTVGWRRHGLIRVDEVPRGQ